MKKMEKVKSEKLSLDAFKTKMVKRSDASDLSAIAGGILGACHSSIVCVEYYTGQIICVTVRNKC